MYVILVVQTQGAIILENNKEPHDGWHMHYASAWSLQRKMLNTSLKSKSCLGHGASVYPPVHRARTKLNFAKNVTVSSSETTVHFMLKSSSLSPLTLTKITVHTSHLNQPNNGMHHIGTRLLQYVPKDTTDSQTGMCHVTSVKRQPM